MRANILIIENLKGGFSVEGPTGDYQALRSKFFEVLESNSALNKAGKSATVQSVEIWDSGGGRRKRARFLNQAEIDAIEARRKAEAEELERIEREKQEAEAAAAAPKKSAKAKKAQEPEPKK